MALDPRTPVLVGAAAVQQREPDPTRAEEPIELMARALEAAAQDAGSSELLKRADSIRAPRGFWSYPDPCRLIAERVGAREARTEVAEIGVLQTTLFGRAAADIAAGQAEVVLLAGGEAHYRTLCARRAGVQPSFMAQADVVPDSVLRPSADLMHPLEVQHGLVLPVTQFAMMENALRAAEGDSLEQHRDELARLWSDMSRVAAANPNAWRREVVSPEEIREPLGSNRMLAFPYTKLHNSQWYVDQAAGLVLTSVASARALGLPEERWLFPLAVADSNFMTPLSCRRVLHRSPGFAHAGARAFERAGLGPDDVAHQELYSCFPVAVRVQQRELGLDRQRPITVSGGMSFAGGPLNNFVLQALVQMGSVLRGQPGSVGLVTAVSGILTKQGVSLWSSAPPARPFGFDDVSAETELDVELVELREVTHGMATVAGYTVLPSEEKSGRTVALCDLEDGGRTLVSCDDAALAEHAQTEELVGRRVRIDGSSLELA